MANTDVKPRYGYIDNMKLAACVLVALGHFFMSMTANGLMPYTNLYYYLLHTVYTFHVPIFFICSGFLYQKANHVHSLNDWRKNILNKLLNLGVPYAVFTTVTVLLKTIFAEEVTSPSGELADTLFIHPTAPYWYLYALFFLFVFIPCVKSKKQATGLLIAAAIFKIAVILLNNAQINVPEMVLQTTSMKWLYAIVNIPFYALSRLIWFALGISLSFVNETRIRRLAPFAAPTLLAGAVLLSILTFEPPAGYRRFSELFIGLLLCLFVIFAAVAVSPEHLNRVSAHLSEYFMPVFVMHTICAAGLRILLLKLGVRNLAVHIAVGLVGSFLLPVLAYEYSILPKRLNE